MRRYFCLKCETANNCKCGTDKYRFAVSDKLRIPPTDNKVIFRKFLSDCRIFPNMISHSKPELIPLFRNLLRKVKFFDTTINGFSWTNVPKGSPYEPVE